jgi:hypothetical protein
MAWISKMKQPMQDGDVGGGIAQATATMSPPSKWASRLRSPLDEATTAPMPITPTAPTKPRMNLDQVMRSPKTRELMKSRSPEKFQQAMDALNKGDELNLLRTRTSQPPLLRIPGLNYDWTDEQEQERLGRFSTAGKLFNEIIPENGGFGAGHWINDREAKKLGLIKEVRGFDYDSPPFEEGSKAREAWRRNGGKLSSEYGRLYDLDPTTGEYVLAQQEQENIGRSIRGRSDSGVGGVVQGLQSAGGVAARGLEAVGAVEEGTADASNRLGSALETEASRRDPSTLGKVKRGVARSLTQMGVAAAAGGGVGLATGAGTAAIAPAVIGSFGASTGNEAYTRGIDANMTPGEAKEYAANQAIIETGVTAAMQLVGAGGLENMVTRKGVQDFLVMTAPKLLKNFTAEQVEELTIAGLSEMQSRSAGMKPQDMVEIFKDTFLQTAATMGVVSAPSMARSAAKAIGNANEWVAKPENAAAAKKIAEAVEKGESISRKQMESLGLPKMDAQRRNAWGEKVKKAVDGGVLTGAPTEVQATTVGEGGSSSLSSQPTPGPGTDVTPNAATLAATTAYDPPNVNTAATLPDSQTWRGDVTKDPRWLAARQAGTLKPPPKKGLLRTAGPTDETMSPEELGPQPKRMLGPMTPRNDESQTTEMSPEQVEQLPSPQPEMPNVEAARDAAPGEAAVSEAVAPAVETWRGEAIPKKPLTKKRQDKELRAAAREYVGDDAVAQDEFVGFISDEFQPIADAHAERERAKKELRRIAGITAGTVHNFENTSRDHTNVARFDEVAHYAWQNPDLAPLALRPNDADHIWSILKEGVLPPPSKTDPKFLSRAAEYFNSLRSDRNERADSHPDLDIFGDADSRTSDDASSQGSEGVGPDTQEAEPRRIQGSDSGLYEAGGRTVRPSESSGDLAAGEDGSASFDFGAEEFDLEREPAQRVVPEKFENNKGTQRRMLTGMDALAGQGDLFDADNVNAKDDIADVSEEDIAARIEKILMPPKAVAESASPPPKKSLTRKPKSRPAVESAKAEFFEAVDDLTGLLKKRGLFSNPQFDPEVIGAVSKVLAKALKVGVVTFTDFLKSVKERYGEDTANKLDPLLRNAWDAAQGEFSIGNGGNAESQAKAATGSPSNTTGTKNAKTDELRAKAGFDERDPVDPETRDEWDAKAKKRMDAYPSYAVELAAELADAPRALDPVEEMTLNRHIRDLENQRQAGEDVREEMLTAIEASERAGTVWGRAGVARQAERAADFSLEGLVRQHLRSVNERPSDEQMAKYEGMAAEIEKQKNELDKLQWKLMQAEIDKQIAEAKAAAAKPSSPESKGTKRERLQKKATDAVSAFKDAWGEAIAAMASTGSRPTSSGLDVAAIESLSKAAKAAAGVIKAYTELGVDSFLELLARIKKDIGDITAEQRRLFEDEWSKHSAEEKAKAPPATKPEASEIGTLARKLARFAVESGVEGRDDVIDAVHGELQRMGVEVTRSQTMEAMSGYGDFRELSKDEVSIKLRGINGEIQQLLKLEDMQSGKAPKKTGSERREPTDEERRLIKQVNEAKKKGGYVVTDPERQLKSALGAAKTAMRNRIADLEQEIAKREKVVKESTPLQADAELTELRAKRDKLLEEHKKIFPAKKSLLSDAQKLKMAEKAMDRQINELQADLDAGRLGSKPKGTPLTSPELEAKRKQLAALKGIREQARAASPEYQAQEAAKHTARYRKSLERQKAFWEKRRDDARAGKLPEKRKPTPVSNEVLEKKYQIELVKRQARAEIEEAERAARGKVGKALGFGGDLLDLSRAIQTGFELSAVLRQGAAYTLGFPRQAIPAVVKSIGALFSRRADFAIHDNLMSRPNHADYARGGLDSTASDGPLSQREELLRSRIVSWLAQTEGAAWALPRWAAEGVLGGERAFRSFLNTMRADLFDYMKDSVEASRPGTWSEDDAKIIAKQSNIVSGRGTLLGAIGLSRIFFAPRWVWSRVQAAGSVASLTTGIGWKGDAATRLAVGKVYVRAALGMAAFMALKHAIYSLTADDDEHKPEYEFDPRSSDFGKMRLGETRLDSGAGFNQLVVLAARLLTGQTKRGSGEIVSIRGEDVPHGADDSRDVIHRFLDSKLAPLPGAVMDFMAGKNIVGGESTASDILTSRVTPMTWSDIWEAEKELNVPQGTVAAIEAFFGTGISTYGPKSEYRNADESERKELREKGLKGLARKPVQPEYLDMLSAEEKAKIKKGINKSLMNAANVLAQSQPAKLSSRDDWKKEGENAFKKIVTSGVSYQQLRNQYEKYLYVELQDQDDIDARLERFRQRYLRVKKAAAVEK